MLYVCFEVSIIVYINTYVYTRCRFLSYVFILYMYIVTAPAPPPPSKSLCFLLWLVCMLVLCM